jgi:hypothetical protein
MPIGWARKNWCTQAEDGESDHSQLHGATLFDWTAKEKKELKKR